MPRGCVNAAVAVSFRVFQGSQRDFTLIREVPIRLACWGALRHISVQLLAQADRSIASRLAGSLDSDLGSELTTMSDFDFDSYLTNALAELDGKQDALRDAHGIGAFSRFVVDYVAESLEFFEGEALRARATIIPVATHLPAKNSLKWAWANDQYPQTVRDAASRLRGLSDLIGFEVFRSALMECDESMAWEIAALACKYMQAIGVYRVPHGHIHSYVLITQVTDVA
jgi:hypothetical protein